MEPKSKSYTPMPEVPQELLPRFQLVMQAISGGLTVSEGARQLGVSRNHFQSIMHKALEGMSGYNLGGLMLRYSPTDHSGLRFTDLSIVAADGTFRR